MPWKPRQQLKKISMEALHKFMSDSGDPKFLEAFHEIRIEARLYQAHETTPHGRQRKRKKPRKRWLAGRV